MAEFPLQNVRVLISGAGVAGPALACSLARYGAQTSLVEIAPKLRESGFAVDFRGPTHFRVLEKLGVLAQLRALQTHGSALCCVDAHGRELFRLPPEFTGGDLEVYRSDLSRVLYERSRDTTEYLFGNSIVAMRQSTSGVHVEFAHGATRTFDLVIGADGVHSAVRRFVFGPEQRYVKQLGHCIAGWSLPNRLGAGPDSQQYVVPGRMASVSADLRDATRALALFVFASGKLDMGWQDIGRQQQLIVDTYRGMSWHVPALLESLADAPELYFDAISRVHMPNWTQGRVALIGDAAWGVTLGGMGVGSGIVAAYVLAGELAAVGGEPNAAFAAYEMRMRKYAARWQRSANPGGFLAPKTHVGLWLRNALFGTRFLRDKLVQTTQVMATDAALPDYV